MNPNKGPRIYILGAGCSATSGYPLANNFVQELVSFGGTLNNQTKQIKQCVDETVELMERGNLSTIDDLASRIYIGCLDDDPSHRGSLFISQQRDQRIDRAKIATMAMFLAKEASAMKSGLKSYHELLHRIFPETLNWEVALRKSNWHVLTFNYDRLFELAFAARVGSRLRDRFGMYTDGLLNSGINPLSANVQFSEQQFSLLKLHGSVGAWVRTGPGGNRYHPYEGGAFSLDQLSDDQFFPKGNPNQVLPPSPLMIFPCEKHHIRAGREHTDYKAYITSVWERARILVSNASEIRVVGYSFQALDRQSIIDLLSAATNCTHGVIHNLGGEAERICQLLKVEHPEISIPWEPYPYEF